MRIHVYPGDRGGCGHYRMIWPAQAAIDQGHDVHLFLPDTEEAQIRAKMRRMEHGEVVVGVDPPECDVAVFQRPLDKALAETIPFLQEAGIGVVVEIDDDFHAVDPRNIAWSNTVGKVKNTTHKNNLARACSVADVVTMTTPALARRYGGERSVIIPNYVPERYLSIPQSPLYDFARVGWSGSIETHPNDLQEMGGAIPRLLRERLMEFRVVGTGVGVASRVGIPADYEMPTTGWVDLQDYPDYMADIDVGLVPLQLNPFNEAKSWLKGLEFAALGSPFVASPTEPYRNLFEQYGIGAIARKSKHWYGAIKSQMDDPVELGQEYRHKVDLNDLVIERRVQEWVDAWTLAGERRVDAIVARRNHVDGYAR